MATTPINPSWTYPQAGWATGQSQGDTDSFDTFQVGDNNTADNWHSTLAARSMSPHLLATTAVVTTVFWVTQL
jgi:hypothetical protein